MGQSDRDKILQGIGHDELQASVGAGPLGAVTLSHLRVGDLMIALKGDALHDRLAGIRVVR